MTWHNIKNKTSGSLFWYLSSSKIYYPSPLSPHHIRLPVNPKAPTSPFHNNSTKRPHPLITAHYELRYIYQISIQNISNQKCEYSIQENIAARIKVTSLLNKHGVKDKKIRLNIFHNFFFQNKYFRYFFSMRLCLLLNFMSFNNVV